MHAQLQLTSNILTYIYYLSEGSALVGAGFETPALACAILTNIAVAALVLVSEERAVVHVVVGASDTPAAAAALAAGGYTNRTWESE